ncbi:D-alanyl-D-alanine carboxypeptidase/D-alanyl-D-alanine endopeptidase [Paludibacterium yongneupense]|uniref:D-alanyl-D-alanine carboxypeptidase/D-alanyl-D-alanine endopeptidase n=1 Tax=Paludibacterium yongneupense TaxID=400061 RepID=UPI001C0485C5|nr:D-alanyl-D-alanine carboxypeptidase/D-alanyl-D-alanine-endopeptidase [Paludibacterium yongneupense]
MRWSGFLFWLAVLPAHALDLHGIAPDEIAIWAAPVEGDAVWAAHRADVAVNPASTMKLLTSWVALTRLTPDYTWSTELRSEAAVQGDTLQGDLYWVGSGEPRFYRDRLDALLAQLRERGIRHLGGRLVLDGSAFTSLGAADGFDADEGRSFMTQPSALLTNLNAAWLHFYVADGKMRLALDPPLAGVRLENALRVGAEGACGDVRRHVSIEVRPDLIRAQGALPPACDGSSTYVTPLSPEAFAAAAFIGLWQAEGGTGPEGWGVGRTPAASREVAQSRSEPLARMLPDMNKYSSNPMARLLFLTLGRSAGGSDTPRDADRLVRSTLAAARIDAGGLALENGAGLSRRERVSARLLGEVLRAAARGPYSGDFLASLPVAGEEGTLKHRFGDLGARLHLKTGTLDGVRALAGYWLAPDGRRLVLVAIVNARDAERKKAALDAVVGDLVQRFASYNDSDGVAGR